MTSELDTRGSILLLPAAGRDSAANFRRTVEEPIDVKGLARWLPDAEAEAVAGRLSGGRLAVWGQRDNTKGLAGSTERPVFWDRVDVGTLALFSDHEQYHTAARVIGKGHAPDASAELWGSDEYPWLLFLSDVRPVDIPLEVVKEAAGFKASYNINRQALVPRADREAGVWEAITPALVGEAVTPADAVVAADDRRRVWWVNQGATYRAERAGGYLFAPQRDKRGRELVHWTSMRVLRVGDRIVHYANGKIRAVSTVTAESVIADRPAELGERWEPDGFFVRSEYTELEPSIPLSAVPMEVRQLGASKDGPFMVNGRVKEGYLWPVSDALAAALAEAVPPVGELLYVTTPPTARTRRVTSPIDFAELVRLTNWREEDLRELADAVTGSSPQVVLAGPPGTSKTWVAKHLVRFLTGGVPARSRTVQFHPSYGYEEFIEGLRPVADGGAIRFDRVDGIVLDFVAELARAGETETCFLLIDEMNRANLSRVFGELMYLFEYRDEPIDLRYTKGWQLPSNLKFIGTMNTADRSIRSIDIALRRRFDVFECNPDRDVLERYYATASSDVPDLLDGFTELNVQLTDALDRHHTIGHAFFMSNPMTRKRLESVWARKIRPLIDEYFFDQPDLADGFTLGRFWPSLADGD